MRKRNKNLPGRIKSILKTGGKILIQKGVPVLAATASDFLYEKGYRKFDCMLTEMYKKTALNSSILLAINLAGMIVAGTQIFGLNGSRIAASFIFFSALVLSVSLKYISYKANSDYYRMGWNCFLQILKKHSLSIGVKSFVYEKNPFIQLFFEKALPFVELYIPGITVSVPTIEKIVERLVKDFWKKLVLFCGILAVYTIAVYGILKPVLLMHFVHMNTIELFFFPLVYVFRNVMILFSFSGTF